MALKSKQIVERLYLYSFMMACESVSCSVVSDSFATPWTVALQAPLFMGFPRQEYWSVLPCPPLGDLPEPGIQPASPVSLALAGGFFTIRATREVVYSLVYSFPYG